MFPRLNLGLNFCTWATAVCFPGRIHGAALQRSALLRFRITFQLPFVPKILLVAFAGVNMRRHLERNVEANPVLAKPEEQQSPGVENKLWT